MKSNLYSQSKTHLTRRGFLSKLGLFSLGGAGLLGSSGCTVSEIRRGISTSHQLYKGDVTKAITNQVPGLGIPEIDGLVKKQIAQFIDEIAKNWSDKKTASPKEYVKYTDHYKSRAVIDFNLGQVQVETIATQNSKAVLKEAIVQTLLTPEDPTEVDLFNASSPPIGSKPFLLDLVRDQDKQPVRYAWRANRYADYLIKTRYKRFSDKGKVRHSVSFGMVNDYQNQQKRHYQFDVLKQSKRFGIQPALIYGIMETESSFNPYAVSSAPAYGLMQIVPSTAGRDVHRLLHNRDGMPSKTTLFTPARNIEYGAAYLSILSTRYLKSIRNPKSKEYCVIAAYNTGSGNVLKAFDGNRDRAMNKINRLSSEQVYAHLVRNLSTSEARNYVQKVTRNKQKYV